MAPPDENKTPVPSDYERLEGSERRPSPTARRMGPSDPNENITVTIVLRRRPDGPPLPKPEDFLKIPPAQRSRMSAEEFARTYGASQEDIDKVTEFVRNAGLNVVEVHPARRTVIVSGTVAQMNAAFAVDLGRYEHEVTRRRNDKRTEMYRGRDGFIHVPAALTAIIIGVFGLDNRRVTKRNSDDPPNTTALSTATIAQLYNFPTNSAAGQTIAIFSEDGYRPADISSSFGGSPPTVTDVVVDANNSGNADAETTQDICIAAAAAPGAAIAVYFTTYSQQGWVDLVGRVAHPNAGDPICSVLSSSFYVSDGDDATTLANEGVSTSWLTAATAAFQDAAIQGVTVCIASGDTGTDSKVGDGKAHVQYPGSDPWVLAVGGTTIGNVSGSSFDEYVWNDLFSGSIQLATGGGISDFFALPSYQASAGVPGSLNDGHTGRGVPDVAGNASTNAPYSGIVVGGAPFGGNGTSASAPLWAGLIAVINAALGVNVGFVNPALYAIGSSAFRDIDGSAGPTDNGVNGVAGYPAGAGWDACTGWGSPNGVALLNALRSIYTRTLYFIVDKSTFGRDEVSDVISVGGGLYTQPFWIVLEGFSLNQLGGANPVISGPFSTLPGVSIFPDGFGPVVENPSDLYTPQRIRFGYNIIFSNVNSFPAAGGAPVTEILNASITVAGAAVTGEALFELVSGADPYFTNIDPANNNVFYLSQDLRVFSAANGQTPLPGGPAFTTDPYQSIQALLAFVNSSTAYTNPGPDPLNALPGQSGYETADSSVTPLTPGGQQNFNFAIARVRLQGPDTSAAAGNVRVFFRLFVAQSCDTDFQPSTTYKSQLGTSGADAGKPVFPLASGTGITDPAGNSLQTVPFFASDANGTHDYDGTVPNANIRTISIPAGRDKVWTYFGCFLDVYNSSNQSIFPGTHHCIVAEIAYDDAPIQNAGGVTESPSNSDKLAQRNLQITSSGNPHYPETHMVPQAFDLRPSPQVSIHGGLLLNYPDELMIDWGNVPPGSVANIYWPQVTADEVLKLATRLYGTHPLSAADANTIKCKTTKGVTYLPIPSAAGKNFAGLFTVELPNTVSVGDEFNITVRRISTRGLAGAKTGQHTVNATFAGSEAAAASASQESSTMRNWRYVTGAFQVKIPVAGDEALLAKEETTLAILKWRVQHMSPVYRWYPVLQRYLSYVAGRVDGFGGNSALVEPGLGSITGPAEVGGKPNPCVYAYIEANKNQRYYSLLRFGLLALFLVVMGALAAVGFGIVDIKSAAAPTVVLWARILGLLFTIMFFLLEIFCDWCLCYFGHIAGDLDEVLGCRRIKLRRCECPRGLFYTTATMYILLIIFWLVAIYRAA
jgi:Pro-kumamolisin, activation domain